MSNTEMSEEIADDLAAPLDLLLTDAALGLARRVTPDMSWVRLADHLARRPRVVVRRSANLLKELSSVTLGNSTRTPSKRDKRFADIAWTDNPLLRRLVQAYLVLSETADTLIRDAELDDRDEQRMRFVLDNVVDAAAPSNNPLTSPLAWKALIDTGGASLATGSQNFLRDMASKPRVPSMIEANAFQLGKSVAATPGAVVLRSELLEVIQYTPQTPTVRHVPLLIVPPVINKYYVVDMAPGRSMVEYFLKQGQQVFTISWRNPDARHRSWGMDTYGTAILDALEAVQTITGSDTTHLFATCSGGILTAMVLAHLADTGNLGRIAGFAPAVTVLDQSKAGLTSALMDEQTAAAAVAASAARGYLDGRAMAEVFAWLRPNDLVWNYWVNNYLQGRKPAPFDILYWNADTTRMTAALHRDFIDNAMSNALATPGTATMLGSPVDLSAVTVSSYAIAGIADHICNWQACYRSAQLIGGDDRTFVLSTSGHIASMVNPPGNPKATFRIDPVSETEPDEWLRDAETVNGSWWPHYTAWLAERSGPEKDAPAELGSAGLPPREVAPGSYAFDT